MADVSESIGFDLTVETIVPLIDALSKDVEPVVKQHLVEQIKLLAKFCCSAGGETGYKVMLEKLLPATARLLEDDKQEVRQSASMTLVDIAQLVKPDDLGQYILTMILRLAHEDDKEEMRMTAAQLLNLLAETLGYDLCRQFVIPEVVSLAEDPVFRVRKSTALNFHSICKVGGEHELLERLMPAFVRLSKDDMYRVRRACAESLSEISKNVSEDIRLGVLVEIFLRLTHDPSKLVKQSILQQSGMFISTLPSRAVNENILSQYCSMISSPTGDVTVDTELRQICAFTFPAVLQVIGKNRWKEVREVYHNLAQSRNTSIKQTLAYSLHEVANILEDEHVVEEELISVFEEMIQDTETVQMGIIKHLALFLKKLPDLCRISYLPILHEILHSTNRFNWRLRQYLAFQLPDLVALPPKTDVYRTLFPTIMTLLQDPVASVRRESFKGVSSLLNAVYDVISNDENLYPVEAVEMNRQNLDEITRAINSFVTSDKCQHRQLWLELARQLLKDLPRHFFEKEFLPGILELVTDRVLNVRLALAMLLAGWEPDYAAPWEVEDEDQRKNSPWLWFLARRDIKVVVSRLSEDDPDVYSYVSQLKVVYPDLNFRSISCRGRKIPPGGAEPVPIDPTPVQLAVEKTLPNEHHHQKSLEKAKSRSNSLRVMNNNPEFIDQTVRPKSGSFDHSVEDTNKLLSSPVSPSALAAALAETNFSLETEETEAKDIAQSQSDELDEEDNNQFRLSAEEIDYVAAVNDPTLIEELDIIDGIIRSPAVSVDHEDTNRAASILKLTGNTNRNSE
eukprot:CAMPEP_0173150372 /NCGR_PEP_ID=MMETSP1105-20130129/10924_1 /TAXON_ID=2985 /ORGANISM="Ochromonas sp., Strain BG-1" /LENGTH=793 /DNA_ID=CAMNT_0014065501 /DNA_START=238 /DNA_END=2619 /DNA_ORIENTATION=+